MPGLTTVAFDYDGTLTRTGRLAPEVLAALEEARAAGLQLVLVSGRRLADFRAVCLEAERVFHRVVVEDGAVLVEGGAFRMLAPPVAPALFDALVGRGVPMDRGVVLLATDVRHEAAVREEVARLGLDLRLSFNKGALMVLPAAVSKATGLSHALASLGARAEETAAVGDGENDRRMLEVCALGVAVADAVDELKAVADRVLDEPDGPGVVAFLCGLVSDLRRPGAG